MHGSIARGTPKGVRYPGGAHRGMPQGVLNECVSKCELIHQIKVGCDCLVGLNPPTPSELQGTTGNVGAYQVLHGLIAGLPKHGKND